MVVAILQARMSSSRLPGKVLSSILGQPMIERQIERIRQCQSLDRVIVATTEDPSDDVLADFCAGRGIPVFRGSLPDVLDRFYQASKEQNAEYVVRLTGDCPLADPAVIDSVVACCREGGFDYVNNCDPPTFPDGLDVEVIRYQVLVQVWQQAHLPSHREHVTLFIRQNPERFKIGKYQNTSDLSGLRWTVDEVDDLELIRTIYAALYPDNPQFRMADVLTLLDQDTSLKTLNAHFQRDDGLIKSMIADRQYLTKNEGS